MQHKDTLANLHQIRKDLTFWACAVGLATAFVFISFPGLDLTASWIFFLGERQFWFDAVEIGPIVRFAFQLLFAAFCVGVLVGLYTCIRTARPQIGLTFPKWMFLFACLIVAPGLVANTLLKDNWGRARPHQVEQFGGPKTFTPPIVMSNQCERNCSFVSGEAASIFAVFFALALVFPALSQNLIFYGVLAGMSAGLVRILQGGHFLSDVLFSGVIMALTICALHWLFFTKYASFFAHKGIAHLALNRLVRRLQARLGGPQKPKTQKPNVTSDDFLLESHLS